MPLPNSNAVESWEVRRGRDHESNKTEAGEAGLILRNNNGDFDPTNASSPYFGLTFLRRQAKINVQHPITAAYHDVFTGYVEGRGMSRQGRTLSNCDVSLVDMFALLASANIVPGTRPGGARYYASQHVDDRIKALLADYGVPAAKTNIYQGNVNVQESVYSSGTDYLAPIFEAADAEFPHVSNVYVSRGGIFRFRGRYDRFLPFNYPRNYWLLGDDGAFDAFDPETAPLSNMVPIFDMKWSEDTDSLYNSALVTPNGVVDLDIPGQRSSDAGSIEEFGERTLDIPNLIVLDGDVDTTGLEECKRYADHFVTDYAAPYNRVQSVVVHGHMAELDPARSHIWDFVIKVEIGDVVYVKTVNPGGGGFDYVPFFLEGLHHDVSALNDTYPEWVTTLELSPQQLYTTLPDAP